MRVSMQLSFAAPSVAGPGTLVLGVTEGAGLSGLAAEADEAASGALKRAVGVTRFAGKPGETVEVLAPSGLKASRVLLIGLGKPSAFDSTSAERAAAGVIGRLFTSGEKEVTFAIDLPKGTKLKPAEFAAHLALGARLRSYTFNHYRTKHRDEHETTLTKITVGSSDTASAKRS